MAKSVRILERFGADQICISQNPCFPDAYVVDLPLDAMPDQDWREAFELKWKSSRDLWDRKLYLISDKVRLVTTVDEINEKLDWIEKIIEETNDAIKEQYRLIEKEREMIQGELSKQLLHKNIVGTEMLMEALRKRFCT